MESERCVDLHVLPRRLDTGTIHMYTHVHVHAYVYIHVHVPVMWSEAILCLFSRGPRMQSSWPYIYHLLYSQTVYMVKIGLQVTVKGVCVCACVCVCVRVCVHVCV